MGPRMPEVILTTVGGAHSMVTEATSQFEPDCMEQTLVVKARIHTI